MKPCTCFCEQIDHLVDFASALPIVAISVLVAKLKLWHRRRQFVSESGGRHDRRFSIECESRVKAERAG